MPPKGSQKPKKAEATPPPAPKKVTTPKKPKEPVIFKSLDRDRAAPIPVDVTFEGASAQAKLRKSGDYLHILKLESPGAFSLVKTVVFTNGEYEGQQAILLQPAKAFPFLKLPKEAKTSIFKIYFANKGMKPTEIGLEGRRSSNKDVFAKSYADGSKNRVALLAVNKEIYDEAVQIFYSHTLRIESTTTLVDFIAQLESRTLTRITRLSINQYVKTTSRTAMNVLTPATNLSHLHIDIGIFNEGDPDKAAREFHRDAFKLLEAIGAVKGDKSAGVDIMSFGKKALQRKNDDKKLEPWNDQQVDEFKANLKAKLK